MVEHLDYLDSVGDHGLTPWYCSGNHGHIPLYYIMITNRNYGQCTNQMLKTKKFQSIYHLLDQNKFRSVYSFNLLFGVKFRHGSKWKKIYIACIAK